MQLGKTQPLRIVKKVDFGVYLAEEEDQENRVLLPVKQVPEGAKTGDELEVFLYKDSKDRLIATTAEPYITLGKVARLKVKEVTKIGAFLDWGLEKDLFLPFKQQTKKVKAGDECLVGLYTDKSDRLCATMNVYEYLSQESPYQKDDRVKGTVYEISENFGAFVAVDDKYSGLIPKRAEQVLKVIDEFAGVLPFTDKAAPEVISRELSMSKNAFKKAVGHLLKEGRIEIGEKCIRKK